MGLKNKDLISVHDLSVGEVATILLGVIAGGVLYLWGIAAQ